MKRWWFAVLFVTFTSSFIGAQAQNLQHAGTFFDAGAGDEVDLVVPAGVVLTDAHITFSVIENFSNSASLIIRDDAGNYLVYEIVNTTTFNAGVDLWSGIPSTGSLTVSLSCYNIVGNHCQGAIMWSGYVAPAPGGSSAKK